MDQSMIQRVVYLPSPEMQYSFYRERICSLLSYYNPATTPTSVLDLLELYEVSKYLHCESAKPWIEENHFDVKAYTDVIKVRLITAINACSEDEIADIYNQLDYRFHSALLGCISDFSLYSSFTRSVLEKILNRSKHSLRTILKHNGIVSKYNSTIADYMRTSDDSAEILLDRYVNKRYQEDVTLTIPSALSSNDINDILSRYLDSADANWNYVNMIAKSRGLDKYQPTLALKAKADKYIAENNPFKKKDGGLFAYQEHSLGIQYNKSTKVIREFGDDPNSYIDYNVGVLEGADAPTILHSIIATLGLTTGGGIIELTHKNGLLTEYDAFVAEGRDYYHMNLVSNIANKKAMLRFLVFSLAIEELNGQSIEACLMHFYNDYLKNEYQYSGHPLTLSKTNDSTLAKIRVAIPAIEGLLKDYALYSSNQAGDKAIAGRYRVSSYSDVPSPIRKKYVTIDQPDSVYSGISQLMFSDLSGLRYVEPHGTSYPCFFQLVLHEDIKTSQLDEGQKHAVYKLVETGVLFYDDKGIIRIRNIAFLTILFDLYRNGTCMYWRYPSGARRIMDSMVESGFLKYQRTLLTAEEADYLSYILKNDKFTNGPALRNKYVHDQYVEETDSNTMRGEYSHLLLIIALLLYKIEDDLHMERVIKNTESPDEIERNDLV